MLPVCYTILVFFDYRPIKFIFFPKGDNRKGAKYATFFTIYAPIYLRHFLSKYMKVHAVNWWFCFAAFNKEGKYICNFFLRKHGFFYNRPALLMS